MLFVCFSAGIYSDICACVCIEDPPHKCRLPFLKVERCSSDEVCRQDLHQVNDLVEVCWGSCAVSFHHNYDTDDKRYPAAGSDGMGAYAASGLRCAKAIRVDLAGWAEYRVSKLRRVFSEVRIIINNIQR